MSLTELFPNVKLLPRSDKLRLIQLLVVELAQEEGVSLLTPGAEDPVWAPLNAFGAAETLMKMLENHKAAGA